MSENIVDHIFGTPEQNIAQRLRLIARQLRTGARGKLITASDLEEIAGQLDPPGRLVPPVGPTEHKG